MTPLPIVERELRLRSRKFSTHLSRTAAAQLAILVAAGVLIIAAVSGGSPTMGAGMFSVLSFLTVFYCSFEGTWNTVDCLSEEKREGTLGLLFLTDLRGYDIVLGKLISTSLNSFYGLFAVLPVLALSLLLGGVTFGEVGRMALALCNVLFFAIATGLLVSSLSRQQGRAWLAAVLMLGGIGVVLPLIGSGLRTLCDFALSQKSNLPAWLGSFLDRGIVQGVGELMAGSSPYAAFVGAFDAAYLRGSDSFWRSLLGSQGLAWTFLIVAARVLPRAIQERGAEVRTVVAQRPPGQRKRDTAQRAGLLQTNPVLWLCLRHHRHRALPWLLAAVPVAAGVGALFVVPEAAPMVFAFAKFPCSLALYLHVILQTCQFFAEGRGTGTLELLLTTPLAGPAIIAGQLNALLRIFLGPWILLGAGTLVGGLSPFLFGTDAWPSLIFAGFGLGSTLWNVTSWMLDLFGLIYFGMWMALTVKKPNRAVTLTLLFGVVLPTVVFCLPRLLLDLFFILWCRSRLQVELRRLAGGRPERPAALSVTTLLPPVIREPTTPPAGA